MLYLELLKAYQTNCFEVFNGFFCVDFLEFFLHQLFRLIFLVQKVLQNSGEKISQKNICKNNCNFFLQKSAKRPVQKNCAEIIEKNMCKNYCKKICAKRAFESLQKNMCFESLKASENTWWSWRLCVYYVLLLVAGIVSEEVVYMILTTYATLSYVPQYCFVLFSTC